MKVFRKMEYDLSIGDGDSFQIGDQINVGLRYKATCQKVGKSGAIFMFDQCINTTHPMITERKKIFEYINSDLRRNIQNLVMCSMFDEIRDIMVPFKKTGDLLRIPTAEELFGPTEAHKRYEALSFKKQWPLMTDRYNRLGFREDDGKTVAEHWLLQNRHKEYYKFGNVNTLGALSSNYPNSVCGVRLVFKLSS